MTATLTIDYSVNNMKNFYADLISNSNSYYYWIGGTLPWANGDSNPPQANQSYQEMESVYHDMVFGKLLTSSQSLYPLANTTPWTNNTIYAQYSMTDKNYFSNNFCVYTTTGGQYNIYKCVDNNNGVPSTVQPSLKPVSGCFVSSDGYTWKYMFSTTVSSFFQDNFTAITANTAIENAAVPGTIDVYRVFAGGTDYQGFNEGTIRNVISPNQIQLAINASSVDSFYNGCSLYLKSGLGAGQISNIVAYSGGSLIATIFPAFDTYINMQLSNVVGSFLPDQTVSQISEGVVYLYANGYFNIGDTVVQSDTGYQGTVFSLNSTSTVLTNISNLNPMSIGSNGYPIYDTNSITVLTGNVSITTGSNVITSNSANASYANLLSILSVGQYIRVGNAVSQTNASSFSNVRRVTSITNANTANVDIAFANTFTANAIYAVHNALEPISTTVFQYSAVVAETNLTALTLTFSNTTPNNSSYDLGETVKEYSNTGGDLATNGIVSFVNSSTLILSSVQGSFGTGNTIIGQQSNVSATITNISTYPNITLEEIVGNFQAGLPINTYVLGNNSPAGNATVVSTIYIPSDNVEYIVGPTVTVNGDGEGALAYAIVNTAVGSVFNITDVVPINIGSEFTFANVTITANPNYGSGANVGAVVAPVSGHGGDPYTELGSRNFGISFNFNDAVAEVYKFPNYGEYRRAGIIKNPVFQELFINISPPIRNNLSISGNSVAFTNNEIIFQSSSNAGARFLFGNSTIIQIDNISGTFTNTGTTTIRGLVSNAQASVSLVNALGFAINGNQTIFDKNGSNAVLIQVTNSSQIVVANASGKFGIVGDVIYDPIINSYANVISTYTANGVVNVSTVYGLRFNQTSRITLSSNTGPYQVGERVSQQIQQANGLIIDTTHEFDLMYSLISGVYSVGTVLTDTTSGANAVITFANSTYLQLTGVQGTFSVGDVINSLTGAGSVVNAYSVLIVGDVLTNFVTSAIDPIIGSNSGSVGLSQIGGTIIQPDLTRNTGEILYINDFSPFTQNLTSQEVFTTIFGF